MTGWLAGRKSFSETQLEGNSLMPIDRSRLESIVTFPLDDGEATYPFSSRLARENGWSLSFARKVCREYLRFVALMADSKVPLSPSPAVDQAWHLHLTCSRSYWQKLCRETVGRPLHHEPTKGGMEESTKFRTWYRRTLDRYREVFGEEPPADVWPSEIDHSSNSGPHQWVDRNQYWLISKNAFRRLTGWMGAIVLVPICLAWAAPNANMPFPFNLDGPTFLLFYAGALALAILVGVAIKFWPSYPDEFQEVPRLSPVEVAFLEGGLNRAITAAIYSLCHRGNIQIMPKKGKGFGKPTIYVVEAKGVLDAGATSIEKDIFEYVQEGERSLAQVFHRWKQRSNLIENRLVEKGAWENTAESPWKTREWLAMVPMGLMLVLGVLRIGQGISNSRPVLSLILLTLGAAVCLMLLCLRPSRVTPLGEKSLARWKDRSRDLRLSFARPVSELDSSSLFPGVALFGPTVVSLQGFPHLKSWIDSSSRRQFWSGSATGCSGGAVGCGAACGAGGGGVGCGGGGGCGGCGGG
jgi:uncharacterized protein (TIGR04222 family)